MLSWLLGCHLGQLLPEGPALGPYARHLPVAEAPPVAYTAAPQVSFPVVPLLPWGVAYDLDLVLVDRDPAWDMHEYARVSTPDGPLWLAKDARIGTLAQEVVTDAPADFLPELPVSRHRRPVQVVDRSDADWIDVSLSYTNADGVPVDVTYVGPPPDAQEPRRNGSTMGHSRDAVLAVLDVSATAWARRATVRYHGDRRAARRLGGVLPFEMALVQAQGGLARADLTLAGTDDGLVIVHATAQGPVQTAWTTEAEGDRLTITQRQPLRDLVVTGEWRDETWEIDRMTVRQWGRGAPVTEVTFAPPLPDARRRFDGEAVSRFVIDVNGQEGLAVGEVIAAWHGDQFVLDVRPEAPWWVAERPMRSEVAWPGDDTATVRTTLPPPDQSRGRGAKGQSPR